MKRRRMIVLAMLLQALGAILVISAMGLAAWWQWNVATRTDDWLVWMMLSLLTGLAAIAVGRSLQIRIETAAKRESLRESLNKALSEATASDADES